MSRSQWWSWLLCSDLVGSKVCLRKLVAQDCTELSALNVLKHAPKLTYLDLRSQFALLAPNAAVLFDLEGRALDRSVCAALVGG